VGKPTASAPKAAPCTFVVGDLVSHATFGTGKIVKMSPMGNDTLLEIHFTKVGQKKLMANYAKLTKV